MNVLKMTSAALLVSAAMIGTAFAQAPGSPTAGASGSSTIDRSPSGQTPAGGSAGAGAAAAPAGRAINGRVSGQASVNTPQVRGDVSVNRGARVDGGSRVSGRVAANRWQGGNRNWRDGRRWNRGPRGPAVSLGFGFGAPSYYGDSYAYYDEPYYGGSTTYYSGGDRDDAYCSQRFRSYDPASGTYLGYDGMRHPCP